MIQAESDPSKRDEYLQRLMEFPNQVCFRQDPCVGHFHLPFHSLYLLTNAPGQLSLWLMDSILQKWAEIIGQAHQSVDFLKDQDVIRAVLNILQVCFL